MPSQFVTRVSLNSRPVAARRWAVALAAGLAFAVCSSTAVAQEAWAQMPAILARIVAPQFPKRDFDVTKFGAVAGGVADNTKAFGDAIAACAKSGGGRVLVPAGKFLTGAIHLQSGVELHLADAAEIIFSDKLEDYLPVVFVRVGGIELYNYSPLIYARGCANVAVTGKGKLNGNAKQWWNWKSSESKKVFEMGANQIPVAQRVFGKPEYAVRPSFLCLVSCTNVLLEDFTIGSGPNWTIHPIYCQNLTVRRVNVATDGPNNDGIDPDSCRDVLIEHCTFDTGDDCVVLKSGYNEDGWRVGRPTENVIMRYCSAKRGHGGLVVGSEMSGDVRNVFMHDCQFDGTDRAIRIKSKRGRGGVVENIYARNLKVKNMKRDVAILNMDYSSDKNQAANEKAPVFRNMEFEDITADGAPAAIVIQGLDDSAIENIRFKNWKVTALTGVTANWAKNLLFENLTIVRDVGPVFDLKECSGVTIAHSRAAKGTRTFLKLTGASSGGVKLEACDLTQAVTKFETGDGVPENAVEIK
ncbi:MAG: glycoside hydrolase family 28 protein [Verrucomicrobia bacterium]|nr:MAG: glycoside hydrolase family 28 protein [Verrucomicrobiota bacterium]